MWSRDDLIKQRTKEITIEGDTMVIRAFTASEASEFRGKEIKSAEIFGLIAKSVVEPVLSSEDIGLLPASVVTKLTKEIFTYNAFSPTAVADAIAELKKTEDSTSSSVGS